MFESLSFAPQKQAQMDEESHVNLHDVVCLWIWLKKKMVDAFPSSVVDKYDSLFHKGFLAIQLFLSAAGRIFLAGDDNR